MSPMPSASPTPPLRFHVLLLAFIFFLSGCAALIYEVVWFQMLELVIGSSAISLGILLGMFMGGMCVGSLLAPRVLSHAKVAAFRPLCVYAGIELGIGILGLLMLAVIPLAGSIYIASGASSGASSMILRGLIAGVCLLPPAMLIGATLPAIARWVEATRSRASYLGLFYGGNIFGAVTGSPLAAFVLLRLFDITIATLAAVGLNFAAAALAWSLSRRVASPAPGLVDMPDGLPRDRGSSAWIYLSICLSGMAALASEVIWTRQLALFSGATVFAFALILAVFLAGLGVGAVAGSALARRTTQPQLILAEIQILVAAAIGWAAYQLAAVLPYWQGDLARMAEPAYKLRFDLLRCAWAMLPATMLWGASFPLAVAAVVRSGADSSHGTARVYGFNTLGAIAGALGTTFWLLPHAGSRAAQCALIVAAAASAIAALCAGPVGNRMRAAGIAALAGIVAAVAMLTMPSVSPEVLAYGRLVTQPGLAQVLYAEEGIASTVAVSRAKDGALNYHGAGKVQASTEYQDMRLQRMLGHLTTLLPAHTDNGESSFLVIGFGAGITAGAVSIEPRMVRETIVEIEPLVPEKIAPYFREYNFDLIHNSRAHVVIDDGRHFLLTSRETFDGITSDPLDPWVKGTAALYTREFFELARQRLNPGGVMTQFVQLYESNEDAVRSEIATFFDVFPEGLVFANSVMGQGYDLVLVGQNTPRPIDLDELEARLDRAEYAPVAKSLESLGFYSASDLLGTYVARAADLRAWLTGAEINRDRNLRLQYLAGIGLNEKSEVSIFNHMMSSGPRFPPEVFKGSEVLTEYLKRAIESGSSR